MVCPCASLKYILEYVAFMGGRLSLQYPGIFLRVTLYFGKPEERVKYTKGVKISDDTTH